MEESREAEEGGVGTFKGRVGGQEMEMAGAHHKFFFAPSWLEILLHVLLYFQCCLRLLHTAVTAPLACFTPAVVKHNSTPCLYLSSIICIIEQLSLQATPRLSNLLSLVFDVSQKYKIKPSPCPTHYQFPCYLIITVYLTSLSSVSFEQLPPQFALLYLRNKYWCR